MVITIDGVINPVSAEYAVRSIALANERRAEALVIELDTPGGLMDSMREIIKSMLSSDVPVVVYVSPGGARAASAGAFITIASHIAAMAPETNIGSAHPVAGMGQQMDETMNAKVTNDAVAYIKSLAQKRGRNMQWAESAVRNSVSITSDEALSLGVIDLIANSTPALLEKIDGREVSLAIGNRVLATSGASIERTGMNFRQRVLDLISNPNIAYVLMLLGIYGLFFELSNPGAVFPGVVGTICLVLAFYSMQTLPVNYAGLILIVLAIVMFILETQITSYGALSIGGTIALAIGALMLFETGKPFYEISISLVVSTAILTALFFTLVMGLALKAYRTRPSTGNEAMVGATGTARDGFASGAGQVSIHGEIWSARSDETIAKGDSVEVEAVMGLTLKVRKTDKTEG